MPKLNKNEIVAMSLNCYCVDTVASWKKEKKDFFLEKLQNEISSDGTLTPAATAAGRVIAKPPPESAKLPPNKAKPPASNANSKRKHGDTEDKERILAKSLAMEAPTTTTKENLKPWQPKPKL
jgi:hypothetical protein